MRKKTIEIMAVLTMSTLLVGCDKAKNKSNEIEYSSQNESIAVEKSDENKEQKVLKREESKQSSSIDTAPTVEVKDETKGEQYTWNEITVTIPEAWKDKYTVKKFDDGFWIYQKASYEKEKDSGMLCGFFKNDGPMYVYDGATPIAYDKKHLYYMSEPTDVACYYEDKKIMNEYSDMMNNIQDVKASVKIDAAGINMHADEYAYPMSELYKINQDDVENSDGEKLRIGRNEIYARHGYIFKNDLLQSYFNACTWYQPDKSFNTKDLSEVEKANVDLLKKAEDQYAKDHPYPKKEKTETDLSVDLDGDGKKDVLNVKAVNSDDKAEATIHVNGKEFSLDDVHISYYHLLTDHFYLTDISPYYPGLEIAILDDGPSADPITHFLTYDGTLHYIGSVNGFPFQEEGSRDGFRWEGGVTGEIRADIINSCYAYGYWFYDYDAKKLEFQEQDCYEMLPEAHELLCDLPVYTSMNTNADKSTIHACKELYFVGTDIKNWIQLKSKNGEKGYVYIKDGKVADLNKEVCDVFTNLNLFG